MKVWKKNVVCRRNSKCKGPVAEIIRVCSKKKKAIVDTRKFVVGERMEGHEVGAVGRGHLI